MSTQEAIVAIMTVGMVIGLPFLGLTLRFALKPLLDTWLRVRQAQSQGPVSSGDLESLRARVAHLEHMLDHHGLLERPASARAVAELPDGLGVAPRLERERV